MSEAFTILEPMINTCFLKAGFFHIRMSRDHVQHLLSHLPWEGQSRGHAWTVSSPHSPCDLLPELPLS